MRKKLLENIKQRFVLVEITKELFEKYSQKIRHELSEINAQMHKTGFESSNLKLAVEKALSIAANLRQLWVSSSYEDKQHLQKLIFPEGMLYYKEKHEVRTTRVNSLFAAIPLLASISEENKKGDLSKDRQNSFAMTRSVSRTNI